MTIKAKYIVGIDLGDGESAIAWTNVHDQDEPIVFVSPDGERSIVTAIGTGKNGSSLIGSQALLSKGVYEFDVNFKNEPNVLSSIWRNQSSKLLRFAEEFFLLFVETYPQMKDQVQVFIGHPSGWSEKGVKEYRDLFRENKYIPNIQIVPESRSAFIQVRDHAKVTETSLNSVLIVDIGSSTTDFTYVTNFSPNELAIGSDLGARLLDQAIYLDILERHPQRRELELQLKVYESNRYFLFLCRKAKEQHFSGVTFQPQPKDENFKELMNSSWDLMQKLDMEVILRRPLEGFEQGWGIGFKMLLEKAKSELSRKSIKPKVVLLTGGGSRMSFTKQLCQEVFPESIISPDPEPSFSVARGLAAFGRWRYRVDMFRVAIDTFCESDDLAREIRRHMDSIGRNVVAMLLENSVDAVLRPMVHELREGTLSAAKIGNYWEYFCARFSDWLSTDEGQEARERAFFEFTKALTPYLKKEIDRICDGFHIERTSLRLDLKLDLMAMMERGVFSQTLSKGMEMMIGFADNGIPKPLRLLVPKALVDLWMDGERGIKQFISAIYQDSAKLSSKDEAIIIDEIQKQIKEQLEYQARKAESLIR